MNLNHYHQLQSQLQEKVVTTNQLPTNIKYAAGVDVAYKDAQNRMIGAIVVLHVESLQIVDQAFHEMEITFPYVPGLFSFREIPPLLEAYKKLKILPDLIVCDAQGIAHPKGIGMASHLGIELNIPTIGCAKKRLIGEYDKTKLGQKRGNKLPLLKEGTIIGAAVRTQSGIKPMFVSIGHKISLEKAIEWVIKLSSKYRLPETTRQADQLVNSLMKK